MTKRSHAGVILAGLTLLATPAVRAAAPATALATTDMTPMLASIAHPDYAGFVASAADSFKASVDRKKFSAQAKVIDTKIPLDQPYTIKYLTTQKIGAYLNYLFEVTLHNGDQILTSLTLDKGKVIEFHWL